MTPTPQLINIIPNTMIDDFFIFGFIGGVVGYMYYLYTSRDDPGNHLKVWIAMYGLLVSGLLGGLLAIVFDRAIELSIVVGLLNQLIYMAFIRAVKSGDYWKVVKEVLVRYLTGGGTP